jgi:hypothetical protein
MGRTIPSFRIAFVMEKEDWKPFRNALDKSDRKKFVDNGTGIIFKSLSVMIEKDEGMQ